MSLATFFNYSIKGPKNGFVTLGDAFLAPSRYLFRGKVVTLMRLSTLSLETVDSFPRRSFIRAALAVVAFIPCTIIGIGLKRMGLFGPNSSFQKNILTRLYKARKTDVIFKRTSKEHVGQLYDMLECVDQRLNKHKIWYSISHQTLLGAVRHQGIIPWEKDGALVVKKEELERVKGLMKEFEEAGYSLSAVSTGVLKMTRKGDLQSPVLTITSTEKLSVPSFERKQWEFGELKLWGIQTPEKHLREHFGKKWKTHVYSTKVVTKDSACRFSLSVSPQDQARADLKEMTPDQIEGNWKLNQYFGHVYVLNGGGEPRLSQIAKDLARIGMKTGDYEVFKGVDASSVPESKWKRMVTWDTEHLETKQAKELKLKGQTGCYLAHYHVLKDAKTNHDQAKEELKKIQTEMQKCNYDERKALREKLEKTAAKVQKYSSVLILEDNNDFGRLSDDRKNVDYKGVGQRFRNGMSDLPQDWSFLYFLPSGSGRLVPGSDQIAQVRYTVGAKSYAVHSSLYSPLLEQMENINKDNAELVPVDHEFARMNASHPCYAFYPSLAYRRASPSLARGDDSVSTHVQFDLNINGNLTK